MKLSFIFLISLLSANVISQTHSGFGFGSEYGPWTGFGSDGGFGSWAGIGAHAGMSSGAVLDSGISPGVGYGFQKPGVGEKPCLSYVPCEGPGYATGAGYGYGMSPVYTNNKDYRFGYGQSFYQPLYDMHLNDSGRGYNQKFEMFSPGRANFKLLPTSGAQ